MKCSDYIARFLRETCKVERVFGLQGGAVVHLFDSCATHGPKPIFCHHEQAAGFAATAYARMWGYGVAIVTTGPAGTNAMTPLLGAWQDSIPCMFISGQARAAQTSYKKRVRQVGTQEAPIIDLVRPIVKRAYFVQAVEDVGYCLRKAYKASVRQRPGPVWLDIPFDVMNVEWIK